MRFFLTSIFITLTTYGTCCTCGPTRTLVEAYQKADRNVVGTVLEGELVFNIDSVEYDRLINNGVAWNYTRTP